MNENTVVSDVASSSAFCSRLGAESDARKEIGVGGYGVERGMEPSCPGELENTIDQQLTTIPTVELKRLYATINSMRSLLKHLGHDSVLGCADKVILAEMENPITRSQLAKKTNMTREYLHVRLHRLSAMGIIEKTGSAHRVGKGQGEWLWRRTVLADAVTL